MRDTVLMLWLLTLLLVPALIRQPRQQQQTVETVTRPVDHDSTPITMPRAVVTTTFVVNERAVEE